MTDNNVTVVQYNVIYMYVLAMKTVTNAIKQVKLHVNYAVSN